MFAQLGEYYALVGGEIAAHSTLCSRLRGRIQKSRSRLFSDALREYVARHAAEEVTEAMNRVCAELGNGKDPCFRRGRWSSCRVTR